MFYPAQPEQCKAATRQLFDTAGAALAGDTKSRLPASAGWGGVVPHAGWICSGAIAAEAIAALAAQRPQVDLVVVLGAIHTPLPVERGILDSFSRWMVPSGESTVTAGIRDELTGKWPQFVIDDRFHVREHAIEVELPLIQSMWPSAAILPIEMPPVSQAADLGRKVARTVKAMGLSAVYLASSDLTHYGPNYQFTPAGIGEAGLNWALGNDQRLLELISGLAAEKIVPEVQARFNACGAGAIAAMIAACQEAGATQAVVLRHQNSYQTLASVAPQPPTNAVGYAAVWVG
jgi:hypothetical protein